MNPVLGFILAALAIVIFVSGFITLLDGAARRRPVRVVAGAVAILIALVGIYALVWHEQRDGTVCVGARSVCQEVVR